MDKAMSHRVGPDLLRDVERPDVERPAGWAEAALGEVAEMRLGKMLDAAKQGRGMPLQYLRNVNVRWGSVDPSDLVEMSFTDEEAIEFQLRRGDLLVCEGGEPGRCAIWDQDRSNIKFQKAIHRIRLPEGVDARWVMYDLRRAALDGSLESYFTGSTIKHLTGVSLARYRLRIAPAAEHQRIVAKVEELLARVNAARQRLAKVPAILKRFRQSVLAAACSGRLTIDWRQANQGVASQNGDLPATWNVLPFSTITENHDGRRIPIKADDRAKRRGAYPYYGASGRIDTIDEYLFDGAYLLVGEDGANLLARSTPIAFQAHGKFWVNNHAHVVTGRPGTLIDYLELFLNSIDLQDYVTGSAQPKLTQRALNAIPVALPPEDEQLEVVRRVSALFSYVDQIRGRVDAGQSRADRLTQAVLSKAFRGELVATEAELAEREGRDFETAGQLLERIRAARPVAPARKSRRIKSADR
jgi:restriction endonuclease S subunit